MRSSQDLRRCVWVVLACCLLTPARSGQVSPPAYLLDMYDQFSRGGGADGNTVHALLPLRDVIRGGSMLIYNLSAIHAQERLHSAQLHVHRRLLAAPLSAGSLRMRICQITRERVPVLEDIILNLNSSGWQTFDVTTPVRHVLRSRLPHRLLGLRVELKRRGRAHFRLVRWPRARRMHLKPFVVAFTDDAFSMEEDLEHNFLHAPGLKLAPAGGDFDGGREAPTVLSSSGVLGSVGSRARRSMADNRLPAGQTDTDYYGYHVTGAESNNVTVFTSHKLSGVADVSPLAEPDPRLIPYPAKKKHKKWRRRKHKKRKHRKRKTLKSRRLPVKWNDTRPNASAEQEAVSPQPSSASTGGCRRRRLTIDFVAIGWGEWIINPASFDAFYCSGTCSFPLNKASRPTNHATIQSLASMLGVHTAAGDGGGVPAPCCVPDAMDSLTLLYFDETRQNVVLKNYPKMVVKSCSCR